LVKAAREKSRGGGLKTMSASTDQAKEGGGMGSRSEDFPKKEEKKRKRERLGPPARGERRGK